MPIKSILVPVGGGGGEADLALALSVGRELGAQVTALHAQAVANAALPYLTVGMTGRAIDRLIDEIEKQLAAESVRASEAFNAACAVACVAPVESFSGSGFAARMLSAIGSAEQLIAEQGRVNDLVVIGIAGHDDPASVPELQAALMQTGRPVLLAPARAPERFARRIAIAWNGSIEAARALTAAAALAGNAERVAVLCAGEDGRDAAPGPEAAVAYLRAHGIAAEARLLPASSRPIAETLLLAADDEEADLLAMGAYTHSRLRETVLGGVTHDVLYNLDRPVLMAH
jgi:nucleotide-binding universal stress UspA family protein